MKFSVKETFGKKIMAKKRNNITSYFKKASSRNKQIEGVDFEFKYYNSNFSFYNKAYRDNFEKLLEDWDENKLLGVKQCKLIVNTQDDKFIIISTQIHHDKDFKEKELVALFKAAREVHGIKMLIVENAPYKELRSIDKRHQFSKVEELSKSFNIQILDQMILSANSFYSHEQAKVPSPHPVLSY